MTKLGSVFVSSCKPICPQQITKPNNNFKDNLLITYYFFKPKYFVLQGKRITWHKNALGKKPNVVIKEYPKDLGLNTRQFTIYDMVGHSNFKKYQQVKTYMEALLDF